METAVKTKSVDKHLPLAEQGDITRLAEQVAHSFNTIAPFWPLKNLIAVNPLQGLEDLPVEEALPLGSAIFSRLRYPSRWRPSTGKPLNGCRYFLMMGRLPCPCRCAMGGYMPPGGSWPFTMPACMNTMSKRKPG